MCDACDIVTFNREAEALVVRAAREYRYPFWQRYEHPLATLIREVEASTGRPVLRIQGAWEN